MQNLIAANFAIQFKAPHFNMTVMFKIALITIPMESMMHNYHEYNIRTYLTSTEDNLLCTT